MPFRFYVRICFSSQTFCCSRNKHAVTATSSLKNTHNLQQITKLFVLAHNPFWVVIRSTLESSAVATVKIHDLCSNYYKCEVEKIRKCMTIDRQRTSEEGMKCDHEPLPHES